jgi:hypothetical protein
MGLRDRILDYLAKAFMPVPDHPARGGMTGEDRDDRADRDADDESGAGTGNEDGDGDGETGEAGENGAEAGAGGGRGER